MQIEQTYFLVKWLLIAGIVIVGLVMVSLACLTRYTTFIVEHPVKFVVETLLVGFLGALPIFVVSKHRDALTVSTIGEFAIIALKFMAFWGLMELTGSNALFFRKRQRSMKK